MTIKTLAMILASTVGTQAVLAHAHTHVGRNQDQTWGNADDDKLWFFAMPGVPGWPDWGEPLELVKQDGGLLDGWYVCEHLDCWHSAHPDHGNWQLGGDDPNAAPDWLIAIERVSFDAGFYVLDEDTLAPLLTSDAATVTFDHLWMDDKYNENGTLGAWGFHVHTLFAVAPTAVEGETFAATFRALDVGAAGYLPSDAYTMTFVTVPEPLTAASLVVGMIVLRRRKR
ncbi:MAG: hypothetical protein JXQ73_33195 [Phycisphaerae bacterium]|nr:hypothetical protein [Phycisphaerae bacterium]